MKLTMNYPLIPSWNWVADTFAILSNRSSAVPWLYSNFIQIHLDKMEFWCSYALNTVL